MNKANAFLQKILTNPYFKKIVLLFLCIFLFLIGLNIFNLEKVFFIVFSLFVLLFGILYKKLFLSPMILLTVLWSVIFTVIYCFFIKEISVQTIGYYFVAPIVMAFSGQYFSHSNKRDLSKYIIAVLAFSLGLFMRGLINSLATVMSFGIVLEARYYINFIGNGGMTLATAMTPSFVFALNIGFFGVYVFLKEKTIKNGLFMGLTCLISFTAFFFSMVLGNRIVILIFLGGMITFILLIQSMSKRKTPLYIMFGVLAFLFLLVILMYANPFGLTEKLAKLNNFFYRLISGGSNQERINLYKDFFKTFYKYPLGGMFLQNWYVNPDGVYIASYVHNTWLDIYLYGGTVPFIIFFGMTVLAINHSLKIILSDKISRKIIFLIFPLFIGFLLYLLIEPAIMSDQYFFSFIFFIFVSLERIDRRYSYQPKKKKAFDSENYKIVLFANHMSIHMRDLHQSFIKLFGDRYCFIAFEEKNNSHIRYDANLSESKNDSHFKIYSNSEDVQKTIQESDVIIYGNIKNSLLFKLHKKFKNKLFFKLSERMYKKSDYEMYLPNKLIGNFIHFVCTDYFNDYLLTLSSYAYYDFSCIDCFCDRAYKFGYFVEKSKQKDDGFIINNDVLKILFVNRLIGWKHPEHALQIAQKLKQKQIPFEMVIIGSGPKKDNLESLVKNYGLSNDLSFIERMPNSDVRSLMEKTDVVLSTSSRSEGWGAVVGEGMASGCAVISSSTCGSSYELITPNENGYIYDFGNLDQATSFIVEIFNNRSQALETRKKAFNFMKDRFNAEVAAWRFKILLESLIDGESGAYDSSICSNCIIESDWNIKTTSQYKPKKIMKTTYVEVEI